MAKITKEQRELAQAMVEANDALLEGSEKVEAIQNRLSLNLKEQLDFVKLQDEEQEKLIKNLQRKIKLENDPTQLTFLKNKIKLLKQAKDLTEDQIKATLEHSEAQKKLNKAMAEGAQHMLSLIGFGDKFADTTLGKLTTGVGAFVESVAQGNLGLKDMAAGFKKLEVGSRAMGVIANSSTQLMMTQDSMASSFLRSTGASMEFSSALKGGSEELREMGINLENAGHATSALFENTTTFKDASQATRVELISFTGVLMDLGVDANATADSIQTMTKGLGMTESEAMETTESIVRLARSLDMDLNGAMSDFNDLAPRLMEHGENMTEVFEGLLVQSRATGISMQNLVGVAAQFDTFESAAQATARLNGILGGPYLNSLNMVYATEEERLQAMRETLDLSGKSFDSMGRLEKRAFANAAGFQSVGEAAKFFNTNLDDPVVQERIEREKELAAMAKETQDIMEKLKVTMMSLAISMEPALKLMKGILDVFIKVNDALGGSLGILASVAFGVNKLAKAYRGLAAAKGMSAAMGGGGLMGGGGIPGPLTKSGRPDMRYKVNQQYMSKKGGGGLLGGAKRLLGGKIAKRLILGGTTLGLGALALDAMGVDIPGIPFLNKGGTLGPGQAGIVGDGPNGQILPTSELVTGPATVTPMNRVNVGGGGMSDTDITKLAALINSNSNRPIELVMDRERVGSIIGDYQSKKSRQALQTKY